MSETTSDFDFITRLQVIKQKEDKTKSGNTYLKLTLKDITGEISNLKVFPKWDMSEDLNDLYKKYDIGNILEIEGEYSTTFKAKINKARVLEKNEINLADFIEVSNINSEELFKEIEIIISNLQNEELKRLLTLIFSDNDLKKKYLECPSSIFKHHNYRNGNLEHTVSMLKIFNHLKEYYRRDTLLNIDLIYTGIILHDIGKTEEYAIFQGISKKTKKGKLLGHIHIGANIVSQFIDDYEEFPEDLKNNILHMILSHHGKEEWGAVVEPKTDEAIILHYLDMIDSRFKLNN
ncbi:MAG: HD domain-containing protein [Candidatus Thorarchaeota archaeon]